MTGGRLHDPASWQFDLTSDSSTINGTTWRVLAGRLFKPVTAGWTWLCSCRHRPDLGFPGAGNCDGSFPNTEKKKKLHSIPVGDEASVLNCVSWHTRDCSLDLLVMDLGFGVVLQSAWQAETARFKSAAIASPSSLPLAHLLDLWPRPASSFATSRITAFPVSEPQPWSAPPYYVAKLCRGSHKNATRARYCPTVSLLEKGGLCRMLSGAAAALLWRVPHESRSARRRHHFHH